MITVMGFKFDQAANSRVIPTLCPCVDISKVLGRTQT